MHELPPSHTHPHTHTHIHTQPHCFSASFILLPWHILPPLPLLFHPTPLIFLSILPSLSSRFIFLCPLSPSSRLPSVPLSPPLLSAHHRGAHLLPSPPPRRVSANRCPERCGFAAGGRAALAREREGERERERSEESAGEKRRFPEPLGETTPGLTLSDDRGAERLSRAGIKTRNKARTHTHTHTERGGGCSVCGYLRVSAPAAGALQSLWRDSFFLFRRGKWE